MKKTCDGVFIGDADHARFFIVAICDQNRRNFRDLQFVRNRHEPVFIPIHNHLDDRIEYGIFAALFCDDLALTLTWLAPEIVKEKDNGFSAAHMIVDQTRLIVKVKRLCGPQRRSH